MIANPVVADVPGSFLAGQKGTASVNLLRQQAMSAQQQRELAPQLAAASSQTALTGVAREGREQAKFKREENENLMKELAGDVVLAYSMDPGPSRDKILQSALSKATPGTSPSHYIDAILQTPEGEQREGLMTEVIKAAQQRGYLEAPAAPMKTAEQVEREIKIKEDQLGIDKAAQASRESELLQRKETAQQKAAELKPTMQKILDTAQTTAFDSEKTANDISLLAKDFERVQAEMVLMQN